MGYQLGIDVPDSPPHPAFPFDTIEEACAKATSAIDTGFLKITSPRITIQTGPGTIYKMISDEHMQKQARGEEPPLAPFNFVLAVEFEGVGQLTFGFHTDEAMEVALDNIEHEGVLRHCSKEGHEHTFVQGRTGLVWMPMTKSEFLRKQHALAVKMQQAQKEADANESRIQLVT